MPNKLWIVILVTAIVAGIIFILADPHVLQPNTDGQNTSPSGKSGFLQSHTDMTVLFGDCSAFLGDNSSICSGDNASVDDQLQILKDGLYNEEDSEKWHEIVKRLYQMRSDFAANILIEYIQTQEDPNGYKKKIYRHQGNLKEGRGRYVFKYLGRVRKNIALEYLNKYATNPEYPKDIRGSAVLSMLFCECPEQPEFLFNLLKYELWRNDTIIGPDIIEKMLNHKDERCLQYAQEMIDYAKGKGDNNTASRLQAILENYTTTKTQK
jgi:hypothetical protein